MADLLILAIETGAGCGGVSLTRGGFSGGRVIGEYSLQPETSHSRRLLGSVAALMAAAGVAWTDLDALAVSLGPGSFTGLRIGLAAAKGLAMATGLPLVGVPGLDALAAGMPMPGWRLCPVLDARKGQVYAAFYDCEETGYCRRRGDFLAVEPERLAARLAAERQKPVLVFGPGAALCASVLTGEEGRVLLNRAHLHPRAALTGFCAAHLLAAGEGQRGLDLAPLYVRASEAEYSLRAKKVKER